MITLDSNVIVTGVAGEVWTLTEIMPWCPVCCVWWSSDRVTQVSRYSMRMCSLTEIMPWCPTECCVWWSSDRVTQVSRYSIRMCSLEFISSLGMLATQLSHWLLLQTKPTIFRVYIVFPIFKQDIFNDNLKLDYLLKLFDSDFEV